MNGRIGKRSTARKRKKGEIKKGEKRTKKEENKQKNVLKIRRKKAENKNGIKHVRRGPKVLSPISKM